MTRKEPPRASLYVRLSKMANEENVSLAGMTEDLRELCRQRSFREVALHVDNGKSGAIRDRPEFIAWLDDARSGRADVLVAWHVDRMTREGLNVAARIMDVIEGKDHETGKVRFPQVRLMDTRGIDSNDGDGFRLAFVVKAEIARGERERKKDRATAAKRRLAKARRFSGGIVPYGYRSVDNPHGPGKVLAPDPYEASVVTRMRDQVFSGRSLYAITRQLNTEGITPRKAKAWAISSVQVVLTGDAILGRLTYNGKVVRGDDGLPVQAWPPLISLEDHERLCAMLAPEPGRPRTRAARLLSGLCHCANCGGTMRVNTTGGKAGRITRYTCHGITDGRGCTNPVSVSALRLEEYVETEFLRHIGSQEVVEYQRRSREVAGVAEVEAALRETANEMTLPGADIAALAVRMQTLSARRDELAAMPAEVEIETVPLGFTYAERWQTWSVDDRRRYLAKAIETIVVGPGQRGRKGLDPARVTIFWGRDPRSKWLWQILHVSVSQ